MRVYCARREPSQGNETRRSVRPFGRRPAGSPVWRSSRSIRPWADTAKRPAPPVTRSKSSPDSISLTRSCQGAPVVPRIALAGGEVGQQHLATRLQRRLQLGRGPTLGRPRVALRREAPAEHRRRERPELGQPRLGLAVGAEPALSRARPQPPLPLGVARQHRPRPHQRRRRHHEARRPDEADPLEVGVDLGVAFRHRLRREAQRDGPAAGRPRSGRIRIARHEQWSEEDRQPSRSPLHVSLDHPDRPHSSSVD